MLFLLGLTAVEAGAKERPQQRSVLALHTGISTESVYESSIHQFLELPLNHLGLEVQHWNLTTQGLPPIDDETPRYVVTWFDEPVESPGAYLSWLREIQRQDARLAVFGEIGLPHDMADDALALLGLAVNGYVPLTLSSEVQELDREIIGYECQLDPVLPPHFVFVPTDEAVETHLSIATDEPGYEAESSVVVTNERGGLVASGFAFCRSPSIGRMRWLVNPFVFLERAFGLGLRPVPDTTTLSGRRIYFSHIDGDGWGNRSEIDLPGRTSPLSGRVLSEFLFKAYPDLPVGLGLVGGELDEELSPVPKGAEDLAREVYALPNIEPAAHGYSHPIRWGFFENYDRALEKKLMAKESLKVQTSPIEKLARHMPGFRPNHPHDHAETHQRYFGGELARVMVSRPFSLDEEITRALDKATSYAPEGKVAKIYYWTGDALPFEDALALTDALGVGNMNGGDTRMDGQYPSIAYAAPISQMVGTRRQIFAAAANEAHFTDGWKRNFHGQLRMFDFLERTERPYRLKPYHLYYHTYSGDKLASVRALQRLNDEARSDRYIAIWPSRYVSLANAFFDTEIIQTDPLAWRIENRGSLQTLRIDDAIGLHVDPLGSDGVIGARRVNGSLYIALDPSVEPAVLRLARKTKPGALLVSSSWELDAFQRRTCGLETKAAGFGKGAFAFTGLTNGPIKITVSQNGKRLLTQLDRAHGGRLKFELPDIARTPVTIDVSCVEATQ